MTVSDLRTPNDLTTPLGVEEAKAARRRLRVPLRPLLAGIIVAVFALFFGWIALVDDPLGGEPTAVVAIDMAPKPAAPPPAQENPVQLPAAGAAPAQTAPPAGGGPMAPNAVSAGEVEQQSGVVVVRSGGAPPPGAVIVRVPDADSSGRLAPPDPALTENGKLGPLPKVGADGRRPADVYARPVVVPPTIKSAGAPRIAVLVGGMGISQNGTAEAIAKLPPGVTLAFAPYGSDLDRIARQARSAGHEIMLQAPMEPFDYPDNDPGPQTLLTSATPAQNLERLRWQMSRFSGYVGVTNYMGGKFTANAEALRPMLAELADRGLIYADDGSSPRSLAPDVAKPLSLPAPKADIVLDANPSAQAIDGALARLEQLARDKGSAFGVATGLPVTVAKLSDWAKDLDKRGVLLVPVSALARK